MTLTTGRLSRMSRMALLLAVFALQARCGRNDAEHRVLTLPSASPAPADAAAVPDAQAAQPAARPAPQVPLALGVSVRKVSGGLGLSVQNTGAVAISLQSAVSLEHDGQVVSASALSLQAKCAPTPCVTLLPGTEYLAPRWLELPSAERCGALLQDPKPGSRLRIQDCRGERSQEVPLP